MSLDNTSQPSVKYCADKVNAKYIHGRPAASFILQMSPVGALFGPDKPD